MAELAEAGGRGLEGEEEADAEVSAEQRRQHRIAKLSMRLLPLNGPEELEAMRGLLQKVVENITAHPEDLKFRSLKLSNKALRSKIFDRQGSREIMTLLGFRNDQNRKDGEAVLTLPVDADLTVLASTLQWLDEVIRDTLSMGGARRPKSTCCAETTLQLRLPTSKTIKVFSYSSLPLTSFRLSPGLSQHSISLSRAFPPILPPCPALNSRPAGFLCG